MYSQFAKHWKEASRKLYTIVLIRGPTTEISRTLIVLDRKWLKSDICTVGGYWFNRRPESPASHKGLPRTEHLRYCRWGIWVTHPDRRKRKSWPTSTILQGDWDRPTLDHFVPPVYSCLDWPQSNDLAAQYWSDWPHLTKKKTVNILWKKMKLK